MGLHEILVNFGNPEDFQRMCHQLLELEYPDFQAPDDSRGDGGCDGYSVEEAVGVAIWCPEKMEGYNPKFRKKAAADLDALLKFRETLRRDLAVDLDQWIFLSPRDLDPEIAAWLKSEGARHGLSVRPKGTTWLKNRLQSNPQVMASFPQHFRSVVEPAPLLEVVLEDSGRPQVWPEIMDRKQRRDCRLRAVWFELKLRLMNKGGHPLTVYGTRLRLEGRTVAELVLPPANLETRQAFHTLRLSMDPGREYLTPDHPCVVDRNGVQVRQLWLRADGRLSVPEAELGCGPYHLEVRANGADPVTLELPELRVVRGR